MGFTEVYAHRRNSPVAVAFVAELRASGMRARELNSRFFEPGQAAPGAVCVYHDGDNPEIPAHYEAQGVECKLIPGVTPERGIARSRPEPVLTPDIAEPVDSKSGRDGYTVEQSGTWHKLIGPDGEQIGKSKRSEAEAWALLEGS